MLTDNVIEFMNYKNALKGNYRKGVHTMRCILENPAQAADFAASVGAVSVVFGVPVDQPDRNSNELLELVLNSSVCDKATLTFMSQFYPENAESYDTMMNSAERCAEIFATPILWRPVGRSNCLTAKLIVTMAGLNCVGYGDLAAVVSSSVAMTAVAASSTAMTAVIANSTALNAVVSSSTAMTAVAASSVAMTAVAASHTAMTAVIANSTALNAVVSSSTAMTAVIANSTALNAVVSSSTAMAAVAASATARNAITASSTALSKLASSPLKTTVVASSMGTSYSTIRSGNCFIISVIASGSSSYTMTLQSVYSGSSISTTTKDIGAVSTSTVSINCFATAISAKLSASSSTARTFTYIPC